MYCSFVQSWQNTMDALHDKTECIAMTAWKKVKQQTRGSTCGRSTYPDRWTNMKIEYPQFHPFSIGNTSSMGPFSIAMLVYWSVDHLLCSFHMSYGQNLEHAEGTFQSRVGLYRFCSGGTLYKPSWGYRFGYRFRVAPYRFCSNGSPMTLSILLWSYSHT